MLSYSDSDSRISLNIWPLDIESYSAYNSGALTPKPIHPLKAYRIAHGLNQRAAAKRFGVSQGQWSRWERGEQRPNRLLTKRLIRETGASLEILMRVAS